MENSTLLTTLSNLARGMLYFSESESPFVVDNWGQVPASGLSAKIINEYSTDAGVLKALEHKAFFEHLVTKADPSDLLMVENAQKISAFYEYAQSALSGLQVTRIEGAARIPIIITGYLPDGSCIAIQTQAVET
jgi:hypothetical protein